MHASISRLLTVFSMMAVITASASVAVQADSLSGSHPDVSGPTLDFTNIRELDVSTEPIANLFFGPGQTIGDSLVFAPPNDFTSLSSDGGFMFMDGRLSVDISSSDGSTFNGITIDENGAYSVTGVGSAEVNLLGVVVTPDGTFTSSESFVQAGDGQGLWSLSASYAFPATDRAVLIIDNQLETRARPGQNIAFIDKKSIVITPSIPEPGSLILIGLASCVGLGARRRKVA